VTRKPKPPAIDPEFESLIPPLTPAEERGLVEAIQAAGRALDPVKVWRGLVIDGHNRFNICRAYGLPYEVQDMTRDLADRAAVKAWMLKHQASRRNLPRDQILALHLMHGQDPPLGTTTEEANLTRAAIADGKGPDMLASMLTLNMLKRRARPRLAPRPPRGPSDVPHIPEAHELAGVSTLTDAEGNVKGQWNKTRVAGADEPPTPIPDTFAIRSTSTMQRGDGTTVIQWVSRDQAKQDAIDGFRAAVAAHVAEYVRPAPPLAVASDGGAHIDDLITLYPLGDPHIGMLAWAAEVGESFDLKIAERELTECMRQMVARSPRSRTCIIANLGDFWHAQDDNQRTPTSGHKLDVDGRAGKVGRVGLRILRTLIDTALTRHERVAFRSIPGNHDPHSSFWIPEVMGAVYSHEDRITVHDAFAPYQFDTFGANVFGWAHGDGAKIDALGEIMATDAPDLWGAASFRHWHTGHVHHLQTKELRGCVVHTHRTLAGRDAWHHHSGYRSGRSLQALTYHARFGLDSVAVVGVERVRAALGAGAAA
jgi:hypothetical protein